MKRLLILLAFVYACAFAQAQGIGNAKDLQDFIAACNAGESLSPWSEGDSVIVLTGDIDLAKVKKLDQVQLFTGRFDGRGHRLKNWKASAGLFKRVGEGAEVAGLIIDKSCSMKVTSKGGDYALGYIADYNDGIIRACVNEAPIAHKCGFANGPILIGGLVGSNRYILRECSNSGKISSDVSDGEFKEEIFLAVGGLAGGALDKPIRTSVIVHCENTGEVSGVTGQNVLFAGGIIGNGPVRTTLKYNVNRGAIKAELREFEEGKVGSTRIGGIAGQAKADILRCDNFGPVEASGTAGPFAGGIVGSPHSTMVIADCFNYGPVTSVAEQLAQVGGIAGNVARPVRFRGCVNYGKVVFDGVSARARSTAAGIVGSISTPKSQTEGAYVSRCINHGEIYAAGGGNKYDASNKNAIHAGGIVGFADIRPGLRARISDCFNDGKITCVSGRKGAIAAGAYGVSVTGKPLDDWVTLLDKPAADGSNVSGSVKTPDGKPLAGILVTDGTQYVKTSADGSYKMTSDLSKARFIYLSIPNNVRVPLRDGIPQFFKRVPRYAKAVSADFELEPCEAAKDYTVLMIADPQVKPFDFAGDNSMNVWHENVAPDAEAFRASCAGPVYCINLGDLVYNEMYAWDDYLAGAAKINCPTFNVIGNHDYDQMNLFETSQGNIYFETYVGPEHYSFDLGDIHYVVMNTILYDRKSASDKYHYGLDDATLAWLKADLGYVPTDKIVMTCTHHNEFKTPNSSPHNSHNAHSENYGSYLPLLAAYKEVYAWNGHNHENFYYDYASHFGKDTKHGASNIQAISVARCTGALRFNSPLGAFGDPRGYMVMNVRGDKVDWYYKSEGKDKSYQMRAYSPARTGDGSVKVTVWNWSEGWSLPEWYENGVKVADMAFTPGIDPDYKALFDAYDNETNRKFCQPSDKAMMFSITPSPGVTSGEVRVKDLFGNTYSETIQW